MFAAIYLECEMEHPDLVQVVATALRDRGPYRAQSPDSVPQVSVDVIRNSDAGSKRTDFPDGFLHFRYKLETEFAVEEEARGVFAMLLELAWGRGWPAVAVCDFEKDLPFNGGYKSAEIPWPR